MRYSNHHQLFRVRSWLCFFKSYFSNSWKKPTEFIHENIFWTGTLGHLKNMLPARRIFVNKMSRRYIPNCTKIEHAFWNYLYMHNARFWRKEEIVSYLLCRAIFLWWKSYLHLSNFQNLLLTALFFNLISLQGRTFIGSIGFQAETQEPLQRIGACIESFEQFRYVCSGLPANSVVCIQIRFLSIVLYFALVSNSRSKAILFYCTFRLNNFFWCSFCLWNRCVSFFDSAECIFTNWIESKNVWRKPK